MLKFWKGYNGGGSKIFRTDEDGEITIRINRKGKIWINKMLK